MGPGSQNFLLDGLADKLNAGTVMKAKLHCLRSGAGPGGKISGSPEATLCRVTYQTAAVQVGNRSIPGISSAARDGRNAQCHPSNRTRTTATTRSSNESAGETAP